MILSHKRRTMNFGFADEIKCRVRNEALFGFSLSCIMAFVKRKRAQIDHFAITDEPRANIFHSNKVAKLLFVKEKTKYKQPI